MVAVNSVPTSAFSVGGSNNNSRQHRRSKSQTAKILTSTYTLASGIIGSSSSASSLRYMDERDAYCTTSNITDDWSLRLSTADQELQVAQDDIISHDIDSANSRVPHEVAASTLPAAKSVHWANRLDTRFEHRMKSPQDLAETLDSVASSVQAVSSSAAPHAVQAAHQPILEAAKAFVPVFIEIGTVIATANHIPLN